ncbi:hypothetical protein K493DRAFT_412836 [Basidiobolus meristosporus CBS 931.73]|uniref:Uncharacterized protein n=1 Tax=Basidiobolus meristosporus CBS 931.73 TaxID=1314790 RepID=A0A1Y1VTY3_9FUNG|nr:hypothetical protein K493DRAFT_412836 [Basidiobolus meristosporus CBS 931.73]|eukprot:ORX64653.1 hypothetical protein K493DRAFT_412836 [Basidiobolus meristosporus CBS 931.73]
MRFASFLTAAVSALFLCTKHIDALDVFLSGSVGGSITGFLTSIEIPVGYDAVNTYFCGAAWWLGYFGLQRVAENDHNTIFTLWNLGNHTAKIVDAHPDAHFVRCEKDCAEGAASQITVHGDFWKPGVKYWLKVEINREGKDIMYIASIYKDNEWQLVGKMLGPDYGELMSVPANYFYQFIENFGDGMAPESLKVPRRVIYGDQYYRVEGSEKWGPMTNISPATSRHAERLYDDFNYSANMTKAGNAYVLSLDGYLPKGEYDRTYIPPFNYITSNITLPSFLGMETVEFPAQSYLSKNMRTINIGGIIHAASDKTCKSPVQPPAY